MTALFLQIRTAGGLLPACQALAGVSAMLQDRILQAQAETAETMLPAESTSIFGICRHGEFKQRMSLVFGLTLAFPGHCILRHYLFPLQG
jgi:hypothetical protein